MKITAFHSKKQSYNIFKNGIIIFLILFLAKFIQFIKELIVANEIGPNKDLDSFIIGHLILSFFIDFLFIPLGYAIIPIFSKLRIISKETANLLFSKTVLLSFFVGTICLFLILYFIENYLLLIAIDSNSETLELTKKIVYSLVPFYFFNILSNLFGAYLNALKQNIFYTFYPAFPAIFTIIYFIFFPVDIPIFNQVYGFNIGSLIGLGFLIGSCYYHGFTFKINLKFDINLQQVLSQWGILIFSALLLAINITVDKTMASYLGEGSVSHLEYGIKLFSIFSSFAITGISILVFPYFSEKVAIKDFSSIFSFIKKSFRWGIFPIILITFLVYFLSPTIVRILFERGAFDSVDTKMVYPILNNYIICFPVLIFGIIGVRLLNALQKNKLVLYFSIINIILNIALNIIFLNMFGIKGIALSTSLVYIINAFLTWTSLILYFKNWQQNE